MHHRLTLLTFVALLLLVAACADSAGVTARLPTPGAAAPAQNAPALPAAPALPKEQPPVETPGSRPTLANQTPAPFITPSVTVPRPTSSVPQATPLPVQLTFGATGETTLRRPTALAVNKKTGHVFVSDQVGVHQFDNNGKFVKTLIKSGLDTGLRIPVSLDFNTADELLIVDGLANTLLRVNADGKVVGKWGEAEGPKLEGPIAVRVDPQGNIFVLNQASAEVLKLDPTGRTLLKFGGKGEQNGQFIRPRGLALDKDGAIYVSDLSTFLVQKFSPDGKYVKTFGNQRSPENVWLMRGMDIGPDGRLVLMDGANNRIQVFDLTNLTLITEFQNPGQAPGQFLDAEDLRIDGQGNVYIADKGNNRVQKLKLP